MTVNVTSLISDLEEVHTEAVQMGLPSAHVSKFVSAITALRMVKAAREKFAARNSRRDP